MTVYHQDHDVTLHHGHVLDVLPTLDAGSVQTVVTSPPYYGLRDYGVDGQIGLEQSPAEYVAALVDVFRQVRRVLRDDGTVWLNLGDSYVHKSASGTQGGSGARASRTFTASGAGGTTPLPDKNLLGIPWRVAFALQDDGWTLRNDIVWCLSGGAWVWARTAKGDMPVMLKDLVRLNPATVQLWNGAKWTRVLGWGPSTDTTERLELVLRSGERIGCTGGHQWPTRRGNVEARDLRVGDVIDTCLLPQPDTAATPAYLTDDVLWLVGLYLAEGSRSGGTVQLALHADEIGWLPRIRDAVTHLGGTVTHGIAGNSLAVRANGRVLRAVVDTYIGGVDARDKHLRNAAWQLPNLALRQLVQGYLDGDGHHDVKNDRWRIGFTRNYALERDLRTAAARLAATITLHPRTVQAFGRQHNIFRGEWRWTARTGHHSEKDRGEVIAIRASRARQFWDVAVEDEPHLFASASGVLTHNCKPNAMPESVTDRLSCRYEHVFLLSKSRRYWFDLDPIRDPLVPGNEWRNDAGRRALYASRTYKENLVGNGNAGLLAGPPSPLGRNPGDVWAIPTAPYPGAHFATMPPALARRCILAGSPEGATVLDPFTGSGTTGMVARQLNRRFAGMDLSAEYLKLAVKRIGDPPLEFGELPA